MQSRLLPASHSNGEEEDDKNEHTSTSPALTACAQRIRAIECPQHFSRKGPAVPGP